jgi:hypothetical protein
MSFLVISHRHGLIPLAHRLRHSGEGVDLIVWRKRFEAAWDGAFAQTLSRREGQIIPETMGVIQEQVESGRVTLITDYHGLRMQGPRVLRALERPEDWKPTQIRLGGWFDGTQVVGSHLLVADLGLWPGGGGPRQEGGMTLVLPGPEADLSWLPDLWQPVVDQLKAQDFVGLVNAGIQINAQTGGPKLVHTDAGWPWLHTHAFLSELENTAETLQGLAEPEFTDGAKYTVVLPVSVPPWPIVGAQTAPVQPLAGLPPEAAAQYFWHDMRVGPEGMSSAGLDGLLGVSRGAGYTLDLARRRAIERAALLQVPEKQFRADVGENVYTTLTQLELMFGIRL